MWKIIWHKTTGQWLAGNKDFKWSFKSSHIKIKDVMFCGAEINQSESKNFSGDKIYFSFLRVLKLFSRIKSFKKLHGVLSKLGTVLKEKEWYFVCTITFICHHNELPCYLIHPRNCCCLKANKINVSLASSHDVCWGQHFTSHWVISVFNREVWEGPSECHKLGPVPCQIRHDTGASCLHSLNTESPLIWIMRWSLCIQKYSMPCPPVRASCILGETKCD